MGRPLPADASSQARADDLVGSCADEHSGLPIMLFRLSRVSFCPTAAGAVALPAPQMPQMPHMHGCALVVEDNVVRLEVAARMLRRLGCRVTAPSGMLNALVGLCETQFDLMLTNLRELAFDGPFCKPIRRSEKLALLSQFLRPRAPEGQRESGAPRGDAAQTLAAVEVPFALDTAALARLTELDPKGENQLLTRVLRAFQTSVARLRPQAEAARLSGDRVALRLVAHTLKSSSASIGAMHLSQLCAQIETASRTGGGDDLAAQLDAFDAALDAALGAIEQLLEERAR